MHTPLGSAASDAPTATMEVESNRSARAWIAASPTLWYAFAGLAILASLYLFLFDSNANELRRYATAVFVGLWAPMFGLLGLRAEVIEMRNEGKGSRSGRFF